MEPIECPYRICRFGLWFLVRKGCIGHIHRDEVNGDRKVWFAECLACKGCPSAGEGNDQGS